MAMNNAMESRLTHSPLKVLKPAFSLQSLNQDELLSTISMQGRLIGMGKWEINSLVETFQKKKSLRKAYHILLEYSQLHNDIHKLILKRQSYMDKMLNFLKHGNSSLPSGMTVGHVASKLAEYSVKAWIAICRWRQLQWSPRPILLSPSTSRAVDTDIIRSTDPVNIIKLFEDDAGDIFHLSSKYGIHLIDAGVNPSHLIVILVTSAANVLSDTAIANAILRPPEVENCEWSMENPADSHTEREVNILLSPYNDIISSMREVVHTELSFENVWQTFSSFKGTDQKNQSRNLPILKLHYSNLKTDVAAQDTAQMYYESCEVLLNFLVRHFSVAPMSKKKGGGDLHSSVLKSLANINGENFRPRVSSPPHSALPPEVDNSQQKYTQFTTSSPVNQLDKRPHSSPVVQSTPIIPRTEAETPSENQHQHNDASHKVVDVGECKSNMFELEFKHDVSSSPAYNHDFDKKTNNKVSGSRTESAFELVEEKTVSAVNSPQPPPTVHFSDNKSDLLTESAVIMSPEAVRHIPEFLEVNLLLSSVPDLFLELKRDVSSEHSESRLVVTDFHNFCPVETMEVINVGDEVVQVAGVSVAGKTATDVTNACETGVKSAVPYTTFTTVTVTLRKQYSGRDLILSKLKNAKSAEEIEILGIPENDIPALEIALQQLKNAVAHLEKCMETDGKNVFNNVRFQMMKKFGLIKTLQYKLTTSLAAQVEAQKLEVAKLERQKFEDVVLDAQKMERARQEGLAKEGKRYEESLRQEQHQHDKTDDSRSRTESVDDERHDELSFSSKKKKRKWSKRRYSNDRDEQFQRRSYRPLIASLIFHQHWCAQSTGNNYEFARGVLDARDNYTRSSKSNSANNWVVSNTIKLALRRVVMKGKGASVQVIAARKLCLWWGLIYPQKVLSMRMQIKTMVSDIVDEMIEKSFIIGAASTKRRIIMMRCGAATVIQRVFRKWKSTVLMYVIFIQKVCKRFLTRLKVLRLVNVVRAAVLVARFLYRRKIRLRKIVGKRVHYKRVIRNYMEHIGYLNRDSNQTELLQLLGSTAGIAKLHSFVDPRQGYLVKRRLDAIIKIQSFFRMLAAQWYYKYLVQEDFICKKVRCAMKILQLRRKILNKRKLRIAAVKMQRTWRGCASRWKLYLQVIAGIKITAAWRKYRQYWKLKMCLRRIEAPVEIVLHGIRNIAAQLIYSRKIKVRVSVWWNSLLHLVDNKDFMTITQSKQPHIIRTTAFYDCVQMPEVVLPPVTTSLPNLPKKLAFPPPVTTLKNRGGKRLSLMAQAQKINVGTPSADENSLSAFVARQSQKKASPSLRGIVKKTMLTNLAIAPIQGGDSDEESESSSDSSSSSSCSDSSENDEDMFAEKTDFEGRRSGLGSNLLTNSAGASEITQLPPLTLPSGFKAADVQTPQPRRTTMMRVSRADASTDDSDSFKKAKKAFGSLVLAGGTVNLINKGLFGFSNAFKQAQNKKKEEEEKKNAPPKAASLYQCNLNEETLYIPGCHGNAVIRFDLFDGE
jgi:hypothetical protein